VKDVAGKVKVFSKWLLIGNLFSLRVQSRPTPLRRMGRAHNPLPRQIRLPGAGGPFGPRILVDAMLARQHRLRRMPRAGGSRPVGKGSTKGGAGGESSIGRNDVVRRTLEAEGGCGGTITLTTESSAGE
jgi:hypothetical protein